MKKIYEKPSIETDQAFEVLAGCLFLDLTNPVCYPDFVDHTLNS